ncbi:MAG: primosomal protein N' [Candidatus Cloacimonadota bacterium]
MYYYKVHLQIGYRDFTYCSEQRIIPGLRVLVSFNRKLQLGISGDEVKQLPAKAIRYLPIEEVLDSEPLFAPNLLNLAEWMASYYHAPLGRVLFACLPSYLQPDLDTQIRWLEGTEADEECQALHLLLPDDQFYNLSELHKANPRLPIYRLAEIAEVRGYVELKRKLAHKDKQKTVNYVRLKEVLPDSSILPAKQLEAYALIESSGGELPLAELSHQVSYSCLKALAKKGIIEIFPRKLDHRMLIVPGSEAAKSIILNTEQETAIAAIRQGTGDFNVNLLYGITGSGKTEVYLEIISDYLSRNKAVVFLIPEIALTPQMVDRFSTRFGENLAIMHSQLSERDRLEQWKRIKAGSCRLVVGARSAILAPVQDLGLIVVDEEHEQSYKQDTAPRYNGRDVAVVRAQIEGAQVILGSATPSLESWHNAQTGKYRLQTMLQRPLNYTLPRVRILDLRNEQTDDLLTPELIDAIQTRLENKQQVILFQNRRGYSSFLQCLKCGELVKCSNCEISMYYHRDREEVHCHYCGNHYPSPRKCPSCGAHSFSHGASGTQKLEQIISLLFPDARILRMDSDSTKERDRYKHMYDKMKSREVDILLGTQMISKGLDFPGVTLVGIVSADISLNVPDFRSAERTFQLITQVAGRSGRGEDKGEVIIQTYNPMHYAILHAANQDYTAFASEEMSYRQRLSYPPYFRLARIVFQSKDPETLLEEMDRLEDFLQTGGALPESRDLLYLGPAPAPFSRLNNLYRHHLIIKAAHPGLIRESLAQITDKYKLKGPISSFVDVDPLSLM